MNNHDQILEWINSSNISQEKISSIEQYLSSLKEEKELNQFQLKRLKDNLKVNTHFLDKAIQDLEASVLLLKETNNQLSSFVKIASHDLKSPIRSISSFSTLLKRALKGKISEKESDYFSMIESNAKSMSQLIDDLLLYTKINGEDLNIREVRLDEILNEVLNNLEYDIRENQVQIKHNFKPLTLQCDSIKINQVLQNLISNSIKFTAIKDVQAEITIDISEEKENWLFSIKDNGIGIEPKFKDEVFQEFNKLNGNTFEGTGMGLSICKKIITKHQGNIWVGDHEDKGTQIFFTINKNLVSS